MLNELKKLKELYNKNVNIIDYIKQKTKSDGNTLDMIQVSYDLQAGSYIEKAKANNDLENKFSQSLASVLDRIAPYESILEVGAGEATTLCNVISKMKDKPNHVYGFDISYSRIQYAKEHARKHALDQATLFVGDLFNMAFKDNSVDVVYTSHSLEPNGGREREAIMELYRVARKYVVLFEPCYEMADADTQHFMDKHGYIKGLSNVIDNLGYNVIEHRLIFKEDKLSVNKNNTSVTIIEKEVKNDFQEAKHNESPLACPLTKTPIELIRNNYFSQDSLLVYPVVDSIPCLLPENAIIATHYLDK
jgi:ubiquinone/menaquinone biosynthesis C-methylase UbiE/uncharacterized protein YbaR (Trm112 family)